MRPVVDGGGQLQRRKARDLAAALLIVASAVVLLWCGFATDYRAGFAVLALYGLGGGFALARET